MIKKIIIVLIVGLIGGFYWFFHSKKIPDSSRGAFLGRFVDQPAPEPSENSPTLRSLSSARVVSPTINARDNSVIYYEKNTGRVIEVNINSKKEFVASNTSLINFVKTIWSPNGEEVISLFTSKGGAEYRYYNYLTKKVASLGNLDSVAFSPDGTYLVYFKKDLDAGYIAVSQPDGSNPKKILQTKLASLNLYWPAPDKIYFTTQNYSDQTWILFSLSLDGNLDKILDSKNELDISWSRDGGYLLYSYLNNKGTQSLFILDADRQKESALTLNTLASKCAWTLDAKTIICGVPTAPSNDPLVSSAIGDDIYEYALKDGSKKHLAGADFQDLRVQEMFLSPLEDFILFVNGFDGKLYGLKRL
jgi:hypothetical protein